MPLFNVRFNGEGVPTDVLALEGRLKEEFSYKNYRDGDIGSGLDGTTVVTVDAIGAELAIARARRLFQGYMRLGKLTEEREKLFLVVLDEDVGEPIDIIQLPDTVNVECGEMVGSNVFVRAKNEDEAKEKALGVYYDRPFFRVFDKKTKKEADVEYMETYLKTRLRHGLLISIQKSFSAGL